MQSIYRRFILNLIGKELKRKQQEYMEAFARLSTKKALKIEWDRLNPNDGIGGVSMNPYKHLEFLKSTLSHQESKFDEMKAIYKYALDNLEVEE